VSRRTLRLRTLVLVAVATAALPLLAGACGKSATVTARETPIQRYLSDVRPELEAMFAVNVHIANGDNGTYTQATSGYATKSKVYVAASEQMTAIAERLRSVKAPAVVAEAQIALVRAATSYADRFERYGKNLTRLGSKTRLSPADVLKASADSQRLHLANRKTAYLIVTWYAAVKSACAGQGTHMPQWLATLWSTWTTRYAP
jgi:hypothetical protein